MKAPRKPLTFDLGTSPVTDTELQQVTDTELQQASAPLPQSMSLAVPRQQLGVRIPVDIYKRLRVKAVMDGVLVQDLVERAVREMLERENDS